MCKDGKVPVTSADIVKVASTVTPPHSHNSSRICVSELPPSRNS